MGCFGFGEPMEEEASMEVTEDTATVVFSPSLQEVITPVNKKPEGEYYSYRFSYMRDKNTQIKPLIAQFEMWGDSIVVLKEVGASTTSYNTFHIRNNHIATKGTNEHFYKKMDLLFLPDGSVLPQHQTIQTIPVTLVFDKYWNHEELWIQGVKFYSNLPGRTAEFYSDFHPEIRIPNRRKIDISPRRPTSSEHLVMEGDTQYSICQKYDITGTRLMKLNPGLSLESTIFVGEKLKIK